MIWKILLLVKFISIKYVFIDSIKFKLKLREREYKLLKVISFDSVNIVDLLKKGRRENKNRIRF